MEIVFVEWITDSSSSAVGKCDLNLFLGDRCWIDRLVRRNSLCPIPMRNPQLVGGVLVFGLCRTGKLVRDALRDLL